MESAQFCAQTRVLPSPGCPGCHPTLSHRAARGDQPRGGRSLGEDPPAAWWVPWPAPSSLRASLLVRRVPAPAVSCYAGPTGLTGPLLSAAPRRVGPRLEPQVPAGEWAAAAGPAPKGPRMGPHCTGPQCLPSHPSYLLPTPVCSRNGAQAIRPSFSPLRVPSCCRASSPGTLS